MLSTTIHRYIYLLGVYGLLFGIMLGRAPGSFPIIILAANWLLEGNFATKWHLLRHHKIFISFLVLFTLPLLGLVYTSDFHWANNLIRINLPLLAVPLVMFSYQPLSEKEIKHTFYAFLTACFLNTAWCLIYSYTHAQQLDVRDTSRFMSHIRLGLFINMAIAVCAWLILQTTALWHKMMLLALALYFIIILYALGLASGLLLFVLMVVCAGLVYILKKRNRKLVTAAFVLLVGLAFTFNYLFNVSWEEKSNNSEYNQLRKLNNEGRPLIHFDSTGQKENGNYVFSNLQLEDLRKYWNKRVPDDTFCYQPEHNLNRYYVMLRYLASLGYTKDKNGVEKLSEEDILNIKAGVTNYLYPGWNYFQKRGYELNNEFNDYGRQRDVNGRSLAMRLHFWKAACLVIKQNLWLGVGTGDAQTELDKVYQSNFPELKKEWYKHPHNQYLSIVLSSGIIGALLFFLAFFYPAIALKKHLPALYWVFFGLLCLSFITEDTLESQAGMAFYVHFSVLFCLQALTKKQQTPEG